MLTNNSFQTGQELNFLNNDLSGLNDVYKEIADNLGIETTLIIFKLFHGTQISFPNRLFSKEHIHKAIISEYDGKNIPQLAQKYNYSERSVRRILKGSSANQSDTNSSEKTEETT